ncbi:endoplasmic reticulum vesicle protein 25 [Diutina catenulata]
MFVPLFWLATVFAAIVHALHLEVPASQNPVPVCIRDFVGSQQHVTVNMKISGRKGDGQKLDLKITDTLGNEFSRKHDIGGTVKVAFTSHDAAAFDVCFTNSYSGHGTGVKEIELDIESGAAARDWNAQQAAEKLKPNEVELLKSSAMLGEIQNQMHYLKLREERMRDTNESTNSRVKWFSIFIIMALVGLGVWQIQYLRHYFKVKHII